MQAYKNKGFWIGVFAFSIIVFIGYANFLPQSLLALEGSSFETNKGV